jgi:hypothetical protein
LMAAQDIAAAKQVRLNRGDAEGDARVRHALGGVQRSRWAASLERGS